jgi:hypothetical protein
MRGLCQHLLGNAIRLLLGKLKLGRNVSRWHLENSVDTPVVVVGYQSIRMFPLQDGCYSLLIHASTRGHFVDIARIQGGELLCLTPFDIPNRRVKPYACGLPLVTSDSQRRFA